MANTAKFVDIRKDLIVALTPIISKYYGTELDMMTGYEVCVDSSYQIDRVVAKYVQEKRDAEKNSIKNHVAAK